MDRVGLGWPHRAEGHPDHRGRGDRGGLRDGRDLALEPWQTPTRHGTRHARLRRSGRRCHRGRVEIICDGGIRRGSDIVKAVALGANASMAGRAYLYGLSAAGERGVDHVLGLLFADVRRTMALLGCTRVEDLSPELVRRPGR